MTEHVRSEKQRPESGPGSRGSRVDFEYLINTAEELEEVERQARISEGKATDARSKSVDDICDFSPVQRRKEQLKRRMKRKKRLRKARKK